MYVDPTVLFMPLLVLVERAEKRDPYFSYELAPYPPSLFKDNYTRHINKALLAQGLKQKAESCIKRKKHDLIRTTDSKKSKVSLEFLGEKHDLEVSSVFSFVVDACALLQQRN